MKTLKFDEFVKLSRTRRPKLSLKEKPAEELGKKKKQKARKEKKIDATRVAMWFHTHISLYIGEHNAKTKKEIIATMPELNKEWEGAKTLSEYWQKDVKRNLLVRVSNAINAFRKMREAKGLLGLEAFKTGNRWRWFIPDEVPFFEEKRDRRIFEMWNKGERAKFYAMRTDESEEFVERVGRAQDELVPAKAERVAIAVAVKARKKRRKEE